MPGSVAPLAPPEIVVGPGFKLRGKIIKTGKGKVVFGEKVRLLGRLTITGDGTAKIGNDVTFDCNHPQFIALCREDAELVIGDSCYINGAKFVVFKSISIGRDCLVGRSSFMDSNAHYVGIDRRQRDRVDSPPAVPIVCGDNVWIGHQAVVLKGVRIGNNSVVGAATVVRWDVPENVVVIGNPHQVIKKLA